MFLTLLKVIYVTETKFLNYKTTQKTSELDFVAMEHDFVTQKPEKTFENSWIWLENARNLYLIGLVLDNLIFCVFEGIEGFGLF